MVFVFRLTVSLLYDASGKSSSPSPATDTSIVAQPPTTPEAAQGTTPDAAKDSTLVMAVDLNKEKAAPTADVVASSSTSWTDHVSVFVLDFAHALNFLLLLLLIA